jgi:DNA-binding MarR family transcriptional regulator
MKKNKETGKGRFTYEGLDRVMHERARLGIMTSLFVKPAGHTFNELKELCEMTDGNLSRHIKVLKDAGKIEVTKKFENNKPVTTCALTKNGREEYAQYLSELENVIKDAAAAGRAGIKISESKAT